MDRTARCSDRHGRAVSLAAILSLISFGLVIYGDGGTTVRLFNWIDSGSFEIDWALRIDQLTAVMLVVVTGVSALVHIYSIGYMSHDPHIPRFMAICLCLLSPC